MPDKVKKEMNTFEEKYGLVKISQRGTLWFKFKDTTDNDFKDMQKIITSSENKNVKSHFLYILPYDISFYTMDIICDFISYLRHAKDNSIKIVFVTLGDQYTEAFSNLIIAKLKSSVIDLSTRRNFTVGFKTKKGSNIRYTSATNVTQDHCIIRLFHKFTMDDKVMHKIYYVNNDDIVNITFDDLLKCDASDIRSNYKIVDKVRKYHWDEIKKSSYTRC